MALCRAVDNFLTYLTELLSLIFRSRPETLRSGDQVRLDFVLAHPTRAGLIKAIVDREVNQLSYQGMRDLAQFLSKTLAFEIFPDEASLSRAILLIEMRNIIVHARGVANDTFLQRVTNPKLSRGSRIKVSIRDVQNHATFLSESVADIEARARQIWSKTTAQIKGLEQLNQTAHITSSTPPMASRKFASSSSTVSPCE